MIALRSVAKTFVTPAGSFAALRGVVLAVRGGVFVAVVGKSGMGKTTLLNLVAGIDRPTTGAVTVGSTSLAELSHDRLAAWRGRAVGVVFQFFQLLPTLTAIENVMLPMDFSGRFPARERHARALELLARVGVPEQADKLPSTLSGGQQQRVAIARSLANDPPLLVADEPTGNLDSATGAEIFGLFQSLVAEGKTVVVVTHERDTVSGAGRTVTIADGRIA